MPDATSVSAEEWRGVIRRVAAHARPDIVEGLALAMPDLWHAFRIDTLLRQAHFLAQCAHESAGFTTTVELGGPSYFARYDGRHSLGNTQAGDGAQFRGRGLIQLTGRRNYQHFGALLGVDLIAHPAQAAAFPIAAQTAALFWREHSLNAHADRDDLLGITRAINGGLNGLASRRAFLGLAMTALGRARPDLRTAQHAQNT